MVGQLVERNADAACEDLEAAFILYQQALRARRNGTAEQTRRQAEAILERRQQQHPDRPHAT